MEESPSEARKMFRPIRPNPLIPTLTGILLSDFLTLDYLLGKTKANCTTVATAKTELLRQKS
jgi:hypothetical protein